MLAGRYEVLDVVGAGGLLICHLRSAVIDELLRHLWTAVLQTVPAQGMAPRIALVAFGGYGRSEQCPQSDVDLLFLQEGVPTGSAAEKLLADRTSDRFVCELVWPRLGYCRSEDGTWQAGPDSEPAWRQAFPREPQFIAARPPSVALTRSIAKEHKQLLKQQLGFAGYTIGELYPRRTRRATAVNWLLAHLAERGEPLPDTGPLPALLPQPADPVAGHPGDLPVT